MLSRADGNEDFTGVCRIITLSLLEHLRKSLLLRGGVEKVQLGVQLSDGGKAFRNRACYHAGGSFPLKSES